MSKFVIKKASLDEMQFLINLAAQEGWNPGLHDAIPFYETDPNGFLIGELDGRNVGCISAVAYNDHFGFMGFYIVIPECRGKGLGIKLWNCALQYLGERAIGLDGVVAQQENYKKSHFNLYYRNIRYKGRKGEAPTQEVIELKDLPFESVVAYDSSVFGFERERFLKRWLTMPNSPALGIMEGDQIVGYGVIRPCVEGYKIGPLFADNPPIARQVYLALTNRVGEGPIYIDVPEVNKAAVSWVQGEGFEKVFETARMYAELNPKMGTVPKQHLDKIFGVTTFELG